MPTQICSHKRCGGQRFISQVKCFHSNAVNGDGADKDHLVFANIVANAHIECTRLLVAATEEAVLFDGEGISPLQQAQMLSSSTEKDKLVKLLAAQQHLLRASARVDPFLYSK